MKNKYRVVIIGAGPAGIATALSLVDLGVKDIVVLEKYSFPRFKCCAGYITGKTKMEYEEYGLNIRKCHYSLIRDFNIFYKYKKKQNIKNKFLYTNKNIDRVELDYEFYKLAKSRKIKIIENVNISKCDYDRNCLKFSDKSEIFYDYLVFADGTNSLGNRKHDFKKKNIAMQVVFPYEKEEEIQIHFGVTKHGYAWISSYDGVCNVGITDIYNPKVNYKKVVKDFLDEMNINVDIKELKGAFTPIGLRDKVIDGNIYFVGDAAGLCDPLTLSGLRYALNSGKYCASAIATNNDKVYLKYLRKIKIKFFFMIILQKIFYLRGMLFFIFDIGCLLFKRVISFVFNNFFVSKK